MNLDSMKLELSRLNGEKKNHDQENFVKMPEGEGKVVVRLLPWKDLPYTRTRIHSIGGKNYHCRNTELTSRGYFAGDCPICALYKSLWDRSRDASPDEASKLQTEARKIKPVERYYFNVIVRGLENEGPKILSVGQSLHKKILIALVGDNNLELPALGDVTDQATGRDLIIVKKLKKSDSFSFPNYDLSQFANPSQVPPATFAQWMEARHDIAALVNIMSKDALQAVSASHVCYETPVVVAKPVKATNFNDVIKPVDEDERFAVEDAFFEKLRRI